MKYSWPLLLPGVTLADGRIVDGNRRFTCLRRIQRDSTEYVYFETVIMDMDIRADKKQIKLLELAIQYGEEKKVDYDLIDYAVGTYRDIVQTGLLMDVDPRLFGKLREEEKDSLKADLQKLERIVQSFRKQLEK